MEYPNMRKAEFVSRPNRFIAEIEIAGKREICHVKNTGRCRELLIKGAEIFVQENEKTDRKTRYDLISVRKGSRLINIDSSAPNQIFREWLTESGWFQGLTLIRPEQRFGTSRFDFYLETGRRRAFAEIKGVTLEEDGVAMFPDAPTERGLKHLRELTDSLQTGYDAYLIFIVQMKGVRYMEANWRTHPAFGDGLRSAKQAGVRILAVDCAVTETGIRAEEPVEVRV